MNKRLFTSWLILFSLSAGLFAQEQRPVATPVIQPPPPVPVQKKPPSQPEQRDTSDQDVVRITTNLVQVDAVVTKDGKHVTDLKPEEFEIFEDGKRQEITHFSYISTPTRVNSSSSSGSLITTSPTSGENPVPVKPITPRQVGRTMAIVVDDLGMSFESMARVRDQLGKFVNDKLEPTDLVAVIRTGSDVGALQQFTTDRQVLRNAVSNLRWNPCSRVGASVLDPERSLLTVHPPEPQLIGRILPDQSPSSAGVKRPSAAGDPDLCRESSSIYYTIRALRFILRGMADLPGRKSMMVISDSLPTEEQELTPTDFGFKRPIRENANLIDVWTQSKNFADGLWRLAEIAIRSSVVIYGVATQGLQSLGPNPADEISYPPMAVRRRPGQEPDVVTRLVKERPAILRRNIEGADMLAKQTGGFLIRNTNDLGFEKVLEDQGGYYLIGYKPATSTFDRRFHHIKARVKRGGVTVRTRAGFYGVSEADAPAPPSTVRDRMERALISPFGASEIDVRMTPLFANDANRGSFLRLFLSLDPKDLTFVNEADGSHVANLILTTMFFGDNGRVADRHDHKTTLRLRGKPFEQAQREGVVYTFDLPVNLAGVFQFRIAVFDSASGRVGAAGQFISVPDIKGGRLALSGILLQQWPPDPPNSEASADHDMVSDTTLRRFRQGASLAFGYTIYNAAVDAKHPPRLTAESVILRDGKTIYSSDSVPIDSTTQTDPKRISAGARLQLGAALTPGEYVLKIIINDRNAKSSAIQWIEFEVVN